MWAKWIKILRVIYLAFAAYLTSNGRSEMQNSISMVSSSQLVSAAIKQFQLAEGVREEIRLKTQKTEAMFAQNLTIIYINIGTLCMHA